MRHAIIFDCEWLTNEGAPSRFWCGPYDPDPLVVQIGAVKVGLSDGLPVTDTFNVFIQPHNRLRKGEVITPFCTELTGVSQKTLDQKAVSLAKALDAFSEFSKGSMLWSWGKDELVLAQNAFVSGITMPIDARRFDNAAKLFLKAGMPYEDILKTASSRLSSYYNLTKAHDLVAHDGLDDALSIVYALQFLEREGALDACLLESACVS